MTVNRVSLRNALAVVVLGSLLSACATGPVVRTQSAPNLDLSSYSTYDYVKQPGTDRGRYRSFVTEYLEAAVDRQMQARGFTKSAHDPGLLIDFHTQVRDKVRGYWSPGYGWGWGGGGYGYGFGYGWGGPAWGFGWGGPGWWGPGAGAYGGWGSIDTYSEGTLSIDVIDAKSHDAIWSGSAVSPVSRAALEHPRASIDQEVGYIFEKFPKPAIGGQPSGQAH
ncbi:MAG: DUF4136 domain-containing protein [Steroidobacteraceae bacterium]